MVIARQSEVDTASDIRTPLECVVLVKFGPVGGTLEFGFLFVKRAVALKAHLKLCSAAADHIADVEIRQAPRVFPVRIVYARDPDLGSKHLSLIRRRYENAIPGNAKAEIS